MTESLDLLDILPGTGLTLMNGATVNVKHNPRDGMWLFCEYLSHPSNPSVVDGREHAVFAQDISHRTSPDSDK